MPAAEFGRCSAALRYGATSSDVADLQRRLNGRGPTRLPRPRVDGRYGVLTMARVLEFQSHASGLAVDRVAGLATLAKLSEASSVAAAVPAGRCILVDLVRGNLTAYRGGRADLRVSPIAGGTVLNPTTRGVFAMTRRRVPHYPFDTAGSRTCTAFALYYNGAEAIRLGPTDSPTRGGIYVGQPHAERLFCWAGPDVVLIVVKMTR